ncbi:hypothetical protein PQX77_009792 [Marasmius sp. AFHP31]|nr:hypothetical protein PQX77_009792 [Marasmius sp. AFHP31]
MSEFFQNSRNFTIAGGNFNHIQGDQVNYTTTIIQKKERTESDEFHYVRRGAICKLRDIGSFQWQYTLAWDRVRMVREKQRPPTRADRTICAARVLREPGMVFTVVQYSGPEARKGFEEDFAMFTRSLTSEMSQVYGYNKSEIPSLILYNELVPVAHLLKNIGFWGQRYIFSLSKQLGCDEEELWMDPTRKVICRGPPGPDPDYWFHGFGIGAVGALPLSAEFLQEDLLLSYLVNHRSEKVDQDVVGTISSGLKIWHMPEQTSQPIVTSVRRDQPIAITNNAWTSYLSNLAVRTTMENGLTRFTLADDGSGLLRLEWNGDAEWAWMSQAWSVFHAHGISLGDNLSDYKFSWSSAFLKGRLSYSQEKRKRRSQQPIYLWVCPLLPDMAQCESSSLHYWSFRVDGHCPLPPAVCHDLGLPVELNFCYEDSWSWSWPSAHYECLHQYQLLRGFDPTTTEFARHLGYEHYIFQPLGDSNRFEMVQQELPPSETVASTSTSDV